jgi:hypothetical protein
MASLLHLRKNLVLASFAAFVMGASSVHCGGGGSMFSGTGAGSNTGGTGTGTGNGSNTGGNVIGLGGTDFNSDASNDYSAEQFFQNDPPPMSCDGGGMPPPIPGGTPECPDDKNLPGCPCSPPGMQATCWTGLRKNRNDGDCKDGMTTCTPIGETGQGQWGPCVGEVLPVAGATGKAACECFSGGFWHIDNLEPCFLTVTDSQGNMTTTAYASTPPPMGSPPGTAGTCPFDQNTGTPTVPASWSTDTLKVDCAGVWTLCYTIKAGDPKNPQPSDCVLGQSCTTVNYPGAGNMVNTTVPAPDLPGWSSTPAMAACIQQFLSTGGYGEMSVNGQSDQCESIGENFQYVPYCPLMNPPPGCSNGAGGPF